MATKKNKKGRILVGDAWNVYYAAEYMMGLIKLGLGSRMEDGMNGIDDIAVNRGNIGWCKDDYEFDIVITAKFKDYRIKQQVIKLTEKRGSKKAEAYSPENDTLLGIKFAQDFCEKIDEISFVPLS